MKQKFTLVVFIMLAMMLSISTSHAQCPDGLFVQCDAHDVRCFGQADGMSMVNANGGISPYVYSWTGPGGFTSTSQSNFGLLPGIYCVTITDGVGCTATCCDTVGSPTMLVATATFIPPTPCNYDGVINITASGGTLPYMYSIDGGITFTQSPLIGNVPCGSFTITVRDANGCVANTTVIIPCAGITIIDSGCCLYIRPAGVYTYIWSDGSTADHICPTTPGQYSITVISSAGCQLTANFYFPGCCHLVCHDTTICYQVLDTAIAFNPPTFSDTACTAVSHWHRFIGNNNHYVIGLNHVMWYALQPDGSIDSCTQNVIMNAPAPASINLSNTSPTIISGTINICLHGTVYFSTIGSINIGLWSWDFGDGFYSNATNPNHQYNFTGSYMVHVTGYDACGNPHRDSVRVIVDALAGPSIECPSVVCAHANATYTAVGGCPTAVYSWVVVGGVISSGQGTASIIVNWGNGPIGTVTVTITNCAGLCSGPVTAVVPIVPATLTVYGDTIVCPGTVSHYHVDCIPGTTYTWTVTPINSYDSIHQDMEDLTVYWNANYTGPVTIVVNYGNILTGNGCGAGCSGSGTITVNVLPVFSITGPDTLCPNAPTNIPFASINNALANWTLLGPPPTYTTLLNNVTVGALNSYIWNAGPGVYTVNATLIGSGVYCNTSASKTVVVLPSIPAPNLQGPDTVCKNQPYTYFVIPNTPNVTYIWNVVGGTFTGSGTSIIVTWGNTGPYSISVTQQLTNNPFCMSPATSHPVNFYPTPPVLAITAGPGGSCQFTTIQYTTAFVSNANYSWSITPNPSGNGTILSGGSSNVVNIAWNTAGNATLTLIRITCIAETLSIPITINAVPAVPVINTLPQCNPATFTSPTVPASNLSWNLGGGSPGTASGVATVTNTYPNNPTPTTYNVVLTYTDANGCTAAATAVANINPVPPFPAMTLPVAVCENAIGTYNFTSGSPLPFPGATYNWTIIPPSAGTITSSSANSVTVQWNIGAAALNPVLHLNISSACPPSPDTNYNIPINPVAVATITAPNPLCLNTQATFIGSAGTGLTWNFGANGTGTTNVQSPNNVSFSTVGTQTVTLTVTNASGCPGVASAQVNVNPIPIAQISTANSLVHCPLPYIISISALNGNTYSFAWQPTSTAVTYTPNNTANVNATVNAYGVGMYVVVTNSYGCTASSNSIVVDSCPIPNPPCQNPPCPVCVPDPYTVDFSNNALSCPTALFTPFNISNNVTLTGWNFGDGNSAGATNSPISHTYTLPGAYTVTLYGTVPGTMNPGGQPCTFPFSVTHSIEVPILPNFFYDFQCNGNVMQTILHDNSLYYNQNVINSWDWFLNGSVTPFYSGQTPPPMTFNNGDLITLTIHSNLQNVTCSYSVNIVVPLPIAADFTSTSPACQGVAISFTDISAPANANSWSWNFGNILASPTTSTNQNPSAIYPSPVTGNQTVTLNVTDIYGCTSSMTHTVSVTAPISATITGGPTGCGSVILGVTPAGNTYIWSNGATTATTTVIQSGTVSVTVTPITGCPYTATDTITIYPLPIAVITGQTGYCFGAALNLHATSGNYTYDWRYSLDGYVATQGTAAILNSITPATGTYFYEVIITDNVTGCKDTSSPFQIFVDPIPSTPIITPVGPITICQNLTPYILTALSGPSYTYHWSTLSTTDTIHVMASGNYSVTVSTLHGCTATDTVHVTVNPTPNVLISGDTVYCEHETLNLTTISDPNYSYQWSGPNSFSSTNNPIIIPNLALVNGGTYTVTVTAISTGCTGTSSVNVIVNPVPTVPVIAAFTGPYPGNNPAQNPLCVGQLFTLKITYPNPLQVGVNYVWNTGQSGTPIPASNSQSYFVTATFPLTGCSSISDTVTIHPLPDMSCVPTGCYTFCDTCEPVTIPGPFGFASYNWQIDTLGVFTNYSNTQNLVLSGLIPGIYNFRLIGFNAFGCSDTSDTLKITITHCPPQDTTHFCDTCCVYNEQFFNDNLIHGFAPWHPANYSPEHDSVFLSNIGSEHGQFDKYVRVVTTAAGDSGNVSAGPDFLGKWCCGILCWDMRIFNDGLSTTLNYNPQVIIKRGTKGFIFTAVGTANENNGWHGFHAPICPDSLPVNSTYGSWTPLSGTLISDWGYVAHHVTDLVFVTDYSHAFGAITGIDNVQIIQQYISLDCFAVSPCPPGKPCPPGHAADGAAFVYVTDTSGCPTFHYLWSNGATTSSISGLSNGIYCVTVTNCCGCTGTCCVTVGGCSIIATCTATNIVCSDSLGSASVTGSGGVSPYTYIWSNNATTSEQNNLSSGTYCVTVYDATGCTGTCCVTITQSPILVAYCSGTNLHCNGDNSGSVCVDVTGGTSGYNYQWQLNNVNIAGGTSPCLHNLSAGTYCVTVIDSNGCTVTCCVTITQPPILVASCSGTNHICNGDNSGSVCVDVTGGVPNYSYHWQLNNNDITNGNTSCIHNLVAGTYCITVTDSNGCTATCCNTITVFETPSCSITASDSTFCDGNPLTLDAGLWSSYLWDNGSTNETIVVTTSGQYCVTITDLNGCTCVACIDVVATPISTCNITVIGSSTICDGGSVTLDAGANSLFDIYLWSNGATTRFITVNSSGLYCVTVTQAYAPNDIPLYYFCPCTTCIYVIVNPLPRCSITASDSTFCDGNPLTLDAGLWSSYLWDNGSTNETIVVTTSGQYCVTVTDLNGCTCVACIDVVATPISTCNITVIGSSTTCVGGTVTLDAGANSLFDIYLWNNGATTRFITVNASGNYCVTVTMAYAPADFPEYYFCPCTTCIYITVNPTPQCSITASGPTTFCQGGSVTLTAGNWVSYLWSDGSTNQSLTATSTGNYCVTITDANGCTSVCCDSVIVSPGMTLKLKGTNLRCNGDHSGAANVNVSGGSPSYIYDWGNGPTFIPPIFNLSAGIYCVTVTDANGCTAIACVTITEPPALVVTCNGVNPTCYGDSSGKVFVDASGGSPGYSYLWSNGATSQGQGNVAAGTYCITLTDAHGCTATCCVTITDPAAINAICFGYNLNCNGDHSGKVCVDVTGGAGGYNYQWASNNIIIAGANTPCISGLAAGTYCVTVYDKNGCSATCCVTITEPPALVVSCFSTVQPCGNISGKVCVDASGGTPGYTYTWAMDSIILTDGNTPCIVITSPGTYCVTVTDLNGCTATCCVTVSQSTPLTVDCSASILTCKNQISTICVTVAGGTPTYTYLWSNGATTACQSGVKAGTYCVTVTDKFGCSASCCVTVSKYIPLTITCTGTNPLCAGGTGSACVMATGGTPTYTYSWSNTATTSCITGLLPGTYCVTVTDKFGCTATCCTTIKDGPVLPPPIITTSGPTSFCSGGSVTLGTSSAYAGYLWSNSSTTSTITVSTAGVYIVTVTSSNGCTSTSQKTVTVLASPMPVITGTGLATYCSGNTSATLTVGSFGSYIWNTGATTQSIVLPPGNPGTYTVTVTSTNGCTGTASIIVSNACTTPTLLFTSNIAITTAMANWTQAACCASYTIELLDVYNVTTTYTFPCNSHYTFSGLQRGKLYCWRIRTNCNSQMTNVSAWSPYVCFRTLARMKDDEPDNNSPKSFDVYPNPADGHLNVVFSSEDASDFTLKLFDVTGRLVINENHQAEIGNNQYQMNLEGIAKGVYLLVMQKGDAVLKAKILVQ